MAYIISHSGSKGIVVQDSETLEQMLSFLTPGLANGSSNGAAVSELFYLRIVVGSHLSFDSQDMICLLLVSQKWWWPR